jgi:5'-nucleotidase
MKKEPSILITNDDGINAKGINEIAKCLQEIGRVVVFAPDGPRSGMSGAITASRPIRYKKVKEEERAVYYQCTGTPVDCVKLALHTGVVEPDLLVSGINHGGNMSICVHYSGTVGATVEGCIIGIPSIALSLCTDHEEATDHIERSAAEFAETCRLGRKLAEYVLAEGLPKGSYLNLNVPNIPQVKGLRICCQADARFINEYMETDCPMGKAYWLTGPLTTRQPLQADYDTIALDKGYAALVPCKIDVTDYDLFKHLNKTFQ